MSRSPTMIVARARTCVDTRYRSQGRIPGVALDCIGVVAWSTRVHAPSGYDLRGNRAQEAEAALAALEFTRVCAPQAGDVLLIEPGPGLRHLAIVSGDDLVIHAHAGLRRVVEGPVDPGWRVLSIWRLAGE